MRCEPVAGAAQILGVHLQAEPRREIQRERAAEPREYKLLEELNIRPRTSFLARIRNPNPALENA